MDIEDLVKQVNIKFREGYSSLAKIEKELGYGKDSVRQRLKRNNYVFNKELKQFVLQDNINNTRKITYNNIDVINSDENTYNPVNIKTGGIKKMTLDEFKVLDTAKQVEYVNKFADGKKTLKNIEEEYFEFTNIGKYINRAEAYWDGDKRKYILIEPKQNIFTKEEIMFIKQLYNQHKIAQSIAQETITNENLITRSIRIDEGTINEFAKYCKANNIKQSTALKIALEEFMNK